MDIPHGVPMKKAMFWEKKQNKAVQCHLCAHNCKISEGKFGICNVRINKNGTLFSTAYGLISPGVVDPIEKKPLYNFYPGSKVYSFGGVSCNFKCDNCQNWQISQAIPEETYNYDLPPQAAVDLAEREDCRSIAYTYTEPTVFMELCNDCGRLAKQRGLTNVFVSNGSDEVLSFAFYAFFDNAKGTLLIPEFTYSFYPVYCDFYGIECRKVPLSSDFLVDIDALLTAKGSSGIIFPNPNAPTGVSLPRDRIAYLLDNFPSDRAVIIDEAYIDFGGQSAIPMIQDYRNLL